MENKNTTSVYGSIAKWFHWLTAVLIFVSYGAIYYREWFAESDFESWLTIQLHLSIGITLAVIIVLRLVWRYLNPMPASESGAWSQHLVPRMVHLALYLFMMIMPISGYLSIADYLSRAGEIDFFFFYDMTWFKNIEVESFIGLALEQLEEPAAMLHSFVGEWVLVFLIACHILAALYHHFILKDETLSKMTLFKQK